jgi:DASH complex subunit ASK1
MFGHGAVGSTPLGKKQYTGNESWEDSIESPFDKNDRKLREMKIGGGYDDESDMPTPSLPSGYGMPRDDSSMSTSPSIRPPGDRSSSSRPLSSTPKTARTVQITDLRNTPLNAKFPKPKSKSKSGLQSHFAPAEDSDDDLLGGMSPPRTMNYGALPPRVQAINAAVRDKTPRKAMEANAILNDVMSEIAGGMYDSPDIPEPDFIRRYTMDARASTSALDNSSPLAAHRDTKRETRKSMANTSFGSDIVTGPRPLGEGDDSDDSFSSDDSGTVPPPQGDYRSDISYTTNTPGATARYGNVGDFSTIHPGGGESRGAGDDNEVFGVPASGNSGEKPAFGLKKQDEMYTYMGGRLEDAEGTDTPAKINGRAEVLGVSCLGVECAIQS